MISFALRLRTRGRLLTPLSPFGSPFGRAKIAGVFADSARIDLCWTAHGTKPDHVFNVNFRDPVSGLPIGFDHGAHATTNILGRPKPALQCVLR